MKRISRILFSASLLCLAFASPALSALISPTANATLGGTNQVFTWANSGATQYWLNVGSVAGGSGYYNSGALASNVLSANVAGLPSKGAPIHARLYEMIGGAWQITDYTFVATAVPVATIQSHTNGGSILSTNPTISWNNVGADAYYLMVGSYVGGNDYFSSGSLAAGTVSAAVTGLPNNASTIYVRLYTWGNGAWQISDTTYQVTFASAINSHTNGAILAGTTATFTWTAAPGAGAYYLDIGSNNSGHGDYFKSGMLAANSTSATVTTLPTGGVPVYARLYTWVGNAWQFSDTLYTSAP